MFVPHFSRDVRVLGAIQQVFNFDFSVGGKKRDENVENQRREMGEAELLGRSLRENEQAFRGSVGCNS